MEMTQPHHANEQGSSCASCTTCDIATRLLLADFEQPIAALQISPLNPTSLMLNGDDKDGGDVDGMDDGGVMMKMVGMIMVG